MKCKTSGKASSGSDHPYEVESSPPEPLGEQLLELMLEAEGQPAVRSEQRCDGLWVGRLECFTPAEGRPVVTFPGCAPPAGLVARTTAKLEPEDVGQDVALMFEEGDSARPIVMGRLRHSARSALKVEVDGERTVVSGEREIVLRCGEASITLTRAGKVLIRGEYVLTRSSGVNRIQGGSVQIN